MLTVVLAVAVVGIVLLAAAVLTDNTIVAIIVIVVALVGLFLLGQEWFRNRRQPGAGPGPDRAADNGAEETRHASGELEPDEFEPDVPYDDSESSPPADK
ncbi:MAG TPA: hypothetical protein VFB19_01555 [Mycobacterium sp.]|nr:hypothetical protein [Mycobacterium sp.]